MHTLPFSARSSLAVGLVATAALAMAPSSQGGVYTVDPAGNADFLSLQVAVQSVPAESTLLVRGVHRPVVIDRSLAILGGVIDWDPWSEYPTAGLEAHDVEWLYLEDMEIGHGQLDAGISSHGVFARNIESLTFQSCVIRGTPYVPDGGADCFQSGPYHGVLVENVEMCNATDCQFFGGEGKSVWAYSEDGCGTCGSQVVAGDGGDGVHLVGSRFWAEDCLAVGGDGGQANWNPGDPDCDYPPTLLQGGDGGNGLTGDVNTTAVAAIAGTGGNYRFFMTDWGTGQKGANGVPVLGVQRILPDHLAVTPVAEPGGSMLLRGHDYTPGDFVLVYMSPYLTDGHDVNKGTWFLDLPWYKLGLFRANAAGSFLFDGQVSNSQNQIGIRIAFQALSPDSTSEVVVMQIASLTH